MNQFFRFLKVIYMCKCFTCMYVSAPGVCLLLTKARRCVGSPGTEVGCVVSCHAGAGNQTPRPLEEQLEGFSYLICLFYILTTASPRFSPPVPSPELPSAPIHSFPFSVQKGKASHEYLQNVTCQVAIRLSSFPLYQG